MERTALATFAVVIAIAAACGLIYLGIALQPSAPELHSITKDGVEYVFASNIYDAIKVPLRDEEKVYGRLALAQRIWILFRDSEDNSQVALAASELTSKLKHYYAYTQGRLVEISGLEWSQIGNKTLAGTFIEFRGPASGAAETSVSYKAGRILLQATNATDLRLVADRLALLLFEEELAALNITVPERPAPEEAAASSESTPEAPPAESSNASSE
ncbi:MAG: hypothetical protein QW548_02525 [Candidatus Aenigmatarchaeota archaeon]